MAAVLVDSNVIIDLLTVESTWTEWSAAALRQVAENSRLVINSIVFAEISVGYDRIEDVEAALPTVFDREHIPYEAAFLAGKAYAKYRRRQGVRQSALPDFFIGAHAAVAGYDILTRDVARYRSYFPTVRLIAPT